jgi:hypothetical protein
VGRRQVSTTAVIIGARANVAITSLGRADLDWIVAGGGGGSWRRHTGR